MAGTTRRSGRARRRRALVQAAALALFLGLIYNASRPGLENAASLFLRLDPLAAVAAVIAGREWIAALWPALGLLLLALLAGRLFCGWICPLGTTLDAASALLNRRRPPPSRPPLSPRWNRLKYLMLAAILAAALAGVNLAYWGAPIPLITRFYALLIHPLLLLGGYEALNLSRPLLESLDWPALSYLTLGPRRYDSLLFLAAFFGLLFFLELVRPRFWCNYLCPAGALWGLFSRRPLWRRRLVNCVKCGQCHCPAQAGSSHNCRPSECLTCQACVEACPRSSFGLPASESPPAIESPGALFSRRAFLAAAAGGLGLAGLQRYGLAGAENFNCLRPPGALPEPAFLARCLRCGLCMRVCPTNALTSAWLAAGAEGMFSPILAPSRGPCEPDCNLCGQVCPTLAITPLALPEKRWAKIGEAVVIRRLCLAWAEDRRCMVCQEVCPYGAIELVQNPGAIAPAPLVTAAKCFGCGYCELHCPVHPRAIIIHPAGALRLARGSYIQAGRAAGLDLDPAPVKALTFPPGGLPPGFTDE